MFCGKEKRWNIWGQTGKDGGQLVWVQGQTCNGATPPKTVRTQGLSIDYLATKSVSTKCWHGFHAVSHPLTTSKFSTV